MATKHSTTWRAVLSRAPLPMLALSAAYGVFQFNALFVPLWAALTSAAAFELVYVGLTVAEVQDRRRAVLVAASAVVVSILYNSLSALFHIRPALLDARPLWADVALAALHGVPLAVTAYNVSALLLHQEPAEPVDDGAPQWRGSVLIAEPSLARQEAYPAPQQVTVPVQAVTTACSPDPAPKTPVQASTDACKASRYACPGCGAPLTLGAYGAAKKHGHCRQCRPGKGA